MLGFALMKMPRALNVAYERSPLVQQNREEFRRFREAFNKINPAAYRGIERCALSESPEPNPGWVQATPRSTLAGIDEKARENAHMLFPDRASADRFRSFYVTQP